MLTNISNQIVSLSSILQTELNMRIFFIVILLISSSAYTSKLFAQLFVGTDMVVTNGAILKVQNNILQTGTTGNIENAGDIDVDYDYINNGTTTGNATNTGIYTIGGNWENNNSFVADNSTVHLRSADKLITGTAVTDFYTLKLTGGKKLMTIDASAYWLDLGTEHLLTDNNVMLIDNDDPNAIIYTTGFVSSRDDGHLQRKTQSTATYSFPLGSDVGDFRLRPIDITPNDGNLNIYGARLANNNATTDGYDLEDKSALVGDLNDLYYHHLYHPSGTSTANITFYYDDTEDEVTETVGHWINDWTILDNVTAGSSVGNFSTLVLNNYDDFSTRPFILASKADFVYIPNAITPNDDGRNDVLNLSFKEDNLHSFEFYIFDRWGKLVFESHRSNFTWEATDRGELVAEGAYVWRMQYQIKGSTTIVEKMGTIMVLP